MSFGAVGCWVFENIWIFYFQRCQRETCLWTPKCLQQVIAHPAFAWRSISLKYITWLVRCAANEWIKFIISLFANLKSLWLHTTFYRESYRSRKGDTIFFTGEKLVSTFWLTDGFPPQNWRRGTRFTTASFTVFITAWALNEQNKEDITNSSVTVNHSDKNWKVGDTFIFQTKQILA